MASGSGLDVALYLAGLGWNVLPAYCTWKDCKKVTVCGDEWQNKGTTDPAQIEAWWDKKPWAWPGLLSGPGGPLLVDLDGPAAAEAFRELLVSVTGTEAVDAWVYATPGHGGGMHVLWDWPAGGLDFTKFEPVRGLEFRGRAHWTLFYGAKRRDGEYVWLSGDKSAKPPEPPGRLVEWLGEAVRSGCGVGGGGSGGAGSSFVQQPVWEAQKRAPFGEGQRNSALAGVVWFHLMAGDVDEEVRRVGWFVAQSLCDPAMDDDETKSVIEHSISRWRKKEAELYEEESQRQKAFERYVRELVK